MEQEELKQGTITFVQPEKRYATIEYTFNGKKTVNVQLDDEDSIATHAHIARVGDVVTFLTRPTPRGDKLQAYKVKFKYNTLLDLMIQKAQIENRFSGYVKEVDDNWYIKDIANYLFFPLQLSKWEKPPAETAVNKAITYKLINIDKGKISAELFSHAFIPAYREAERIHSRESTTPATVTRIMPHGIHLDILNGGIQVKLPNDETVTGVNVGDKINVLITYISPAKIAVKRAD